MADIKKMKRWFKSHYSKKTVQFDTSNQNYRGDKQPPRSVTPSFPLQRTDRASSSTPKGSAQISRSSTPTFPLESSAVRDFHIDMDISGPQTPSSELSQKVKSRTPNGSLASYYLDSNDSSLSRSRNDSSLSRSLNDSSLSRSRNDSPQRRPLRNGPRFVSGNVDANIRGRNHGYYIKAAGLSENEGNKENLKLIYDRSRMATPLNSNSASRYASNFASRSGSFRANNGHRLYRPKKRPAPRPPMSNGGNDSRQHSLDSRSSNGEVAMKVFRRKKKAPVPPMNKPWIEPEVKPEQVYPIEPPVDYDKDEKNAEVSEEEEDVSMVEKVPKLDLKHIDINTQDAQPSLQIVNIIPPPPPLPTPVNTAPSSARSNSPVPPPIPPKMDDIEGPVDVDLVEVEKPPDPVEPEKPQESKVKSNLPRMGSLLRRDIAKAAQEKMNKKGIIDLDIQNNLKSSHQEFAEELQSVYTEREKRINKSTLIVRHISSSKMFRANPSPSISPRTPVDDLIDKAQEQGKLLDRVEKERQKLRKSARIEPHEWTPEQDLDEVFGVEVKSPTEHLTARGGSYYDITNPDDFTDSSHVLYKKNKYAKPNRKSGNLEKLKKSIGKAFGSIKGLNKKSYVEKTYSAEDGWEILYNEECDKPPSGAVKIKRMEKHAAYAYNAQTGQLVYLPDFDRIIVTQDGHRIRETELNKGKSALNKSMPSFGRKERPSLEGLFESTVSLHSQKAEEERKQIELMEEQFAQVRNINKTMGVPEVTTENQLKSGKAWKSTPDLVTLQHELADDGVLSDTDLPLRTSSIKDYNLEKMKSSDRVSSTKRKKKSKSKKSSSSSDPKSPRQKVLQKGMDYYIRSRSPNSRPTTPNPMYSSDEDDDDEGYRANSNASDQASSDASSKQKSDSFGDSGIGQESLNSSASTASGAPIAAQVQHTFNGVPVTGMTGQMFLAPAPAGNGNHMQMGNPVILAPVTPGGYAPVMLSNSMNSSGENQGPFMYQTLYYPSTLPHGSSFPAASNTESKYNTMPVQGSQVKVPENSMAPSDSTSTLVASNSELNSTLKSENKSSSKVISVTPNIALVSYANSQTESSANNNNSPTDDSNSGQKEFQQKLKKQFVVGPVGYRPVHFNPAVKTKPVSLPEKQQADIIENKDVTEKKDNKPMVNGEMSSEKKEENNNEKRVSGIPAEIQDKYGHEDLIYL